MKFLLSKSFCSKSKITYVTFLKHSGLRRRVLPDLHRYTRSIAAKNTELIVSVRFQQVIMQIASSFEGLSLRRFPVLRDVLKLFEIRKKINLERVGFVNLVIIGGLDRGKRVQMIVVFQKNVSVK